MVVGNGLTVSNPFINRADLAPTEPGTELVYEFIYGLINQRLVVQDLGHPPQAPNWEDILVMPLFVLRVEEIGDSMAIHQGVVGVVRVTLQRA